MAIIKPNVSSVVSTQLPEFIREDYQTFVAFIEAYYKFLESQNVTLDFHTIGDIDTTPDSFVQYFKNELGLNFPSSLLDDKFLLPKLRELYVSKGTEASYRTLFRMLYGKEIEIVYPSKQILKPSDGKWTQDVSIFVQVSVGTDTPESIVGKFVTIQTNEINSTKHKKIKVYIDRVNSTDIPDVYEYFITGGWTGVFNDGDYVKYSSTFFGIIQPTTSSLQILQQGTNFRVGQIYEVDATNPVTSSQIQITAVTATGGIRSAKFIKFGIGYQLDFYFSLFAAGAINNINFFSKDGTSVSIDDSISQLADSGMANKYDYAGSYISGAWTDTWTDTTYAGLITATFAGTTGSNSIDPNDFAVISIKQGAVAKYPGYYKNNDGFLDDTMVIQDSKYYQAFSYVIRVDEPIESYKSIVKNILHPAGTEIFGEYAVTNAINIDVTNSSSGFDTSYLTDENGYLIITESGNYLILNDSRNSSSFGYDIGFINTESNDLLITESGYHLILDITE